MLDTNVAIHLRDDDAATLARVSALAGDVLLSVVTRIELENGIHSDAARGAIRRSRLDRMLATLPVVAFNEEAADAYGRILNAVGYSRRKVFDRMIAAQAIVHRATLITLNADDFRDVPGLDLLAW
jgi:predicted nucleic acid-binding protein